MIAIVALALLAQANPLDTELSTFVPDATERQKLVAHLETESRKAFPTDVKLRGRVRNAVIRNLADKRALPTTDGPFTLSADEIKRTVIDYEVFKLQTYLSAGVFPKRYFGYFDEKWDTATYERTLREVTHTAVTLINAAQAKAGSPTRISDIEVAVTFIAEGGAILLREHQSNLEDIHPVYGVGLDDIASGLKQYPELVAQLDTALGTGLKDVVGALLGRTVLKRNMHFKEAILGTAIMYVFEKEIAARKLKAAEGQVLSELSLDEQYVIGSLVYNSGLTFSAGSRDEIKTFTTGDELNQVSLKNTKSRGPLPVFAPATMAEQMRAGDDYPEQGTSWSGMYHVLQRYGAYQALRRFTDVFDAHGMYKH